MEVILRFVDRKDKDASAAGREVPAGGDEVELPEGMPEACRVLRLLWDSAHECRTTEYGFAASDERNMRTEELMKRLVAGELWRAIRMTRRARDPDLHLANLSNTQELGEYRSGEKLEASIKFATGTVSQQLGSSFVDPRCLHAALALLSEVRKDQQRNMGMLLRIIAPVAPAALLFAGLRASTEVLRSACHQLSFWALAVERAVGGDRRSAAAHCWRILLSHVLIDVLSMLSEGYRQRAQAGLVSGVRSGVMQAMMRQDYEFFDRNAPSVLQERLNCDADLLATGIIGAPVEFLSKLVGIACNLYSARLMCSRRVFYSAVAPLLPVVLVQHIVSVWASLLNERTRRISELAAANSSGVLKEIKTVRQFAMETTEVREFDRISKMKDLLSEKSFVGAKLMDTVFGFSIYGGLVYSLKVSINSVIAGEMTITQCLDVMMKLNYNVVFPARGLLCDLPGLLGAWAPLARICDLLEANPRIEPRFEPPDLAIHSARELASLIEACEERAEGAFAERRLVLLRSLDGGRVPAGFQLAAVTPAGGDVVHVHEKAALRPAELQYPVVATFTEKVRPSRFHGLIEFENVHFAYPTNPQKPVLRGLSFSVQPGQKVALVGGTGCGKSSIMGLLQRLYLPQRGRIKVDGRDIGDYDVRFLRSRMVIVDQSTVLSAATLRDNITYGLASVQDERVEKACREACAWNIVEGKPDHLMSEVCEGGKNLSGGERQRMAIARAMVRTPDVILLDEATSALDAKNERVVQEALDKLAKQGSALVIAHRLSTVRDSDKIVVVNEGVNQEEGTHEELLGATVKEAPAPQQRRESRPSEAPAACAHPGGSSPKGTLHLGPGPRRPIGEGQRDAIAPNALPPLIDRCRSANGLEDTTPHSATPRGLPLLLGRIRPDEEQEDTPVTRKSFRKPSLVREGSAPPRLSESQASDAALSYRDLWHAAMGSESMSVRQMQKKIGQLEGELSALRTRVTRVRSHLSDALPGATVAESLARGRCFGLTRAPSAS